MTKARTSPTVSRKPRSKFLSPERRITAFNDAEIITEIPKEVDQSKSTLLFQFEGLTPAETESLCGNVNFPSILCLNEENDKSQTPSARAYFVITLQIKERRILK